MTAYSIQKILVPVDLSETSLNALETAVAIAVKKGAIIQLINVIEPNYDICYDASVSSLANLTNSSDILHALIGAIQHKHSLTLKLIQEEGNVADVITRQALSQQSDLIVMGTHGASGYRDGFIGSNAYSVIKNARCPVLTVPPKKKFLSFKKILFPIRPVLGALSQYSIVAHFLNGSPSVDVLGLSYRAMERETSVLEKLIEEVQQRFEANSVRSKALWGAGISVSEDVLTYANQSSPDLLVVTAGLDVIAKPHFIGPHTQKIIHAARVPVLNIKKISVPYYAG